MSQVQTTSQPIISKTFQQKKGTTLFFKVQVLAWKKVLILWNNLQTVHKNGQKRSYFECYENSAIFNKKSGT